MTDETKRVARDLTAGRSIIYHNADSGQLTLDWRLADSWKKLGQAVRSRYDAAPAAAPSDRERRLHEALRAHTIFTWFEPANGPDDEKSGLECRSCLLDWLDGEPERHAPGCLAAPLPQEGE
jgi:hypothetical protein